MSANGQVVDEEYVEKARAAGGEDFVELGDTGLQHYGGVLAEEFRPALQGDRAISTYREMSEEDPTIGGALLAIDNLVRRVPWDFEPAPDSGAEGERWADLCRSAIGDMSMSWADTVSSIFTMVPYGFSYHNVVLKHRDGEQPDRPDDPKAKPSSDYDDGLIGWKVISPRSQDSKLRWEIVNGSVRGMWQQVLGGPAVLIPIQHAGLFRTSTKKNSPEGISVLRWLHRTWYFLRRIEEHEGIGIERDLAGLPIAHVPAAWLTSTATADQKAAVAAIERMVQNVRRNANEGMVFPRQFDDDHNNLFGFELLSSGSRRQIDVSATIVRKRAELAIGLLADWLTLGHEANGSRSLGTAKMDMFENALTTWCQGVADIFDAHLTPRLMRANGVAAKLRPRLRPGKVNQVDLTEFSSAYSQLISTGALTPTVDTERWAREQIGAPGIEDDLWTQRQGGLLVPKDEAA